MRRDQPCAFAPDLKCDQHCNYVCRRLYEGEPLPRLRPHQQQALEAIGCLDPRSAPEVQERLRKILARSGR